MTDAMDREPRIYDVVELPETEKGALCPRYVGDRPRRCNNSVEYVFVYEATTDREDDRRKNCRCCAGCKPEVTADDGLRADGGLEDDTYRTLEDLAGREEVHVECTTPRGEPDLCDGWGEDIQLDEPAYMEEGRIHLPGFSWVCPECGNPHDFIIDGVEVSTLV